jgi:hypothetical protein
MAISILGLSIVGPGAGHSTSPSDAGPELRRVTQELLDAIAPGNVAPWQRVLDEGFVHLDENGVVRDRAAFLAELQPLPPGLAGRIEIDKWAAAVHGDTVVTAYEMQEHLDYHGQALRSRFRSMDTWVSTPGGWRLIAEHTAAVLKDPPAVKVSRQELCEYAGSYALTAEIGATIRCTDEGLVSERTGRPPAAYSAELHDVFFVPGQPRTRRIFTRDAAGRVDGFVDRREGEDVRWTRRAEAAAKP